MVGLLRTVFAGLLALPIALALRQPLPKDRRGFLLLVVSGASGFIVFPLLYSIGQRDTSAMHGGMILAACRSSPAATRRWSSAAPERALDRRLRHRAPRRVRADRPARRRWRRAADAGRRPAGPAVGAAGRGRLCRGRAAGADRLQQPGHDALGRRARGHGVALSSWPRRSRRRLAVGRLAVLERGDLSGQRHHDRRLYRLVLGAGEGRHRPHRHDPVLPAGLRPDPGRAPAGRAHDAARCWPPPS